MKTYLSKDFTIEELTKTDTGLYNTPGSWERNNLLYLTQFTLQPIRDYAGDIIDVSSGYRSTFVNDKVGGSKNSQHLLGQAADIVPRNKNININELFNWIIDNLKFGQCINETSITGRRWIHISLPRFLKPNQMALIYDGEKYYPYEK